MDNRFVDHVVVWLDGLAPKQGSFAHALEWAWRLGLPLYSLARGGDKQDLEQLDWCAAACAQRRVAWAVLPRLAQPGRDGGPEPPGLWVVGEALPADERRRLWRQARKGLGVPVLACPRTWQPVCRLLIVNHHHGPHDDFLELAARLCRKLPATPVVLSVGRSEGRVRLLAQHAEEVLGGHRLPADFERAVARDVSAAVAEATRRFGCGHLIIDYARTARWWRWLRGDLVEQILGLAPEVAVLALPQARHPVVLSQRQRSTMAVAWGLGRA